MEVEFDTAKDAANLAKHGLRLARAREVDFAGALVRADVRRDYGEARWLAYVMLDARLHVLAFTWREGRVRAISLRCANSRETRAYGQAR